MRKIQSKKPYQNSYNSAADFYGLSSELFLKGIREGSLNINYVKNNGQNALWYSNLKETELLIDKGIDINHINNDGENALFSDSNLTTAKTHLLMKSGININHTNQIGRSALFERNKEITEILFNHGIDINIIDDFGANALFATELKSALFLVEKGIDLTIKDKLNRTIYFYIEDQVLFKKIDERKVVDINHIDNNYETPLFYNRHLIYFFVEAGMNINYVNPIGRNALFYNSEVKELINSGINIHQKDIDNENALFHQTFINCIYLIENGLSALTTNKEGVKYIDYTLNNILHPDEKEKYKKMIISATEKYEKQSLNSIADSSNNEDVRIKKRL